MPGPEFFGPVEDASATVSLGGAEPEAPGGPVVSYTLRVNGAMHVVDNAWLGESLLHVLRERLGLPGAKEGCGQGVCGTCTVLVDGAPVVSCMVPSATLGDREVTTIEGLTAQGVPTAVQEALIAHGAVQCGFCVPGVVVSAQALLARIPHPDEATVRRALAGHPCRCVGPNRMVAAVCAVAAGEPPASPASLFEPAGAANSGADSAGSSDHATGQRSSEAQGSARPASAGPVNSRSGSSTSSFPAVGVDLTTPTSTGIFPILPGPAAGPAPASAG
ncbi:(2Fe-2S)-binding protein [Yinghuangia sp. YIM S09857]|uniref:(2Fe-2S)-binding protein n=1 Tax=Yinghuangia sp. YIM S09857 TaxID=3436929 RepID=UPI003F5391E3